MTTVFITKYALTHGIEEYELLEIYEDGRYVKVKHPAYFNGSQLYFSPDWHHTKAAAVARAEVMRTNKIASLEKSIAKVKAMTFT